MNSKLSTRIHAWCLRPTDIWDCETTKLLVRQEWTVLRKQFSWIPDDYNTAGFVLNDPKFVPSKSIVSQWLNPNQIYLEAPCPGELNEYYAKNDLSLVDRDDLHSINAVQKLDDALRLLDSVPNLIQSVSQLIRVIGVVKATSLDEDVSYSHPEVPFSIFVSVCKDRSMQSSVRVAESILHEAMHLRLSLIQKVVALLNPVGQDWEQYLSPWRREGRPVNGVLHGIFVFRAILEFFRALVHSHIDNRVAEHSVGRMKEISSQLVQVREFYKSPGLNVTGAALARQLLTLQSDSIA